MDKIKKLYFLPLIVFAALFISACTNADDNKEENDESSSRVRVINDEENNDNTEEPVGDDSEAEDSGDEEEFEEEPVEDEEQEEEEDSEPVLNPDGLQELDGATVTESAALSSYSYGVANGKFEFGWKVSNSTTLSFAEATAGFDQNGDLVVTFPSLVSDYIADTVESPLELGGNLPQVEIEQIDGGTRYTFKFGVEKEFLLKGVSEDRQTVIEVTL